MSKDQSGYKHSASDKALDAAAELEKEPSDASSGNDAGHDAEETSKHDDKGKDRMFEGREQHDQADMRSEKNRLAKDQARHNHPVEGEDAVTESNMHVEAEGLSQSPPSCAVKSGAHRPGGSHVPVVTACPHRRAARFRHCPGAIGPGPAARHAGHRFDLRPARRAAPTFAIVVMRDSQTVYSRSSGATSFRADAFRDPLIGATAAMLRDAGLVQWSDSLSHRVKGVDARWRRFTIEQLVSRTARVQGRDGFEDGY